METDKISLATELVEICLVPQLITDIDTQQIEPTHFKEFKQSLNENLHLLFDLLQQHEGVLFDKTKDTQSFRKSFVLLLCEQSAESAPYRADQLMLQQNVSHLTEKWFRKVLNERCISELVLQNYKALIKVDVWKKNIGAIFGFHRFCQLYFTADNELQMNEVFFVLATGTLFLEHYEPTFKKMGIDLCNILMTFANKSNIISANVHHAVYATCSPNIPKIQDPQINLNLWKCLFRCLEMDESWKRTSDWHKVDELMMDLLKRIAFEGNISRSTILFYFAAKFGSLPHQKCSIIDELSFLAETREIDRTATIINVDWNRLRNEYRKFDSYVIYKWVKKMLLLISNQNVFYGSDFEVAFNLQAIHLTYIVWMLPIPLALISTPALDMLTKFVPTLLDCYRRYKAKELVCGEIRKLFETFLEHFRIAELSLCSPKYVKLKTRFETLQSIKDAIG